MYVYCKYATRIFMFLKLGITFKQMISLYSKNDACRVITVGKKRENSMQNNAYYDIWYQLAIAGLEYKCGNCLEVLDILTDSRQSLKHVKALI